MNKRLAELLADIFGMRESDIHPELKKADVGTWDSLKQMDLVVSLEKEYAIALDIPDILRMLTVKDIMNVLNEKGVVLGY